MGQSQKKRTFRHRGPPRLDRKSDVFGADKPQLRPRTQPENEEASHFTSVRVFLHGSR